MYFPYDSYLHRWVIEDSPTVQVFVGILAAALGFTWLYSVSSAFNRATRIGLVNTRVVTLDTLRLSIAVSNRTVDWNLPVSRLIISLLWWTLTLVPIRLWTGALTPQITSMEQVNSTLVPATGELNQTLYPMLTSYDPATFIQLVPEARAVFTNYPGELFSDKLLGSMSAATASNGALTNHTKWDNSSYSWQGRSYGAGSFVGLADLPITPSAAVQSYHVNKKRLKASARCIRNESTAWGTYAANTGIWPITYDVSGHRPNQNPVRDANNWYAWGYKQFAFPDNETNGKYPAGVVSFSAGSAGQHSNGTPPYFLSIAAGKLYAVLNQTQCELTFDHVTLAVNVSLADRTIRITPQNDATPAPRSEAQGNYIEWALRSLQTITMVQTTAFISTVGRALENNLIQSGVQLQSHLDAHGLGIVADSVEAALDDILAVQNAFAFKNETLGRRVVDATFQVTVVEVGNRTFRTALFAVNNLTCALVMVVMLYTRLFAASPAFDFTDLGSVAAGVLRSAACDEEASRSHLADWGGNAGDAKLRASQLEFWSRLDESGAPLVIFRPAEGSHGSKVA